MPFSHRSTQTVLEHLFIDRVWPLVGYQTCTNMVCAQGLTSISTLLVVASCPPDLISLLVNNLQSCVNSDQTSSDPLYLLLLLVYCQLPQSILYSCVV